LPDKHLTDYLKANARKLPDKPAIIDGKTSITWSELWQMVQAVAAQISPYLKQDSQQVVSILQPNCWQFVVSYLAVLETGHIAMPIDVIYKPLEIQAIIQQIKPVLLICDEANKERIEPANTKVQTFEALDLSQKIKNSKVYLRMTPRKQIASLVFTSGTTGRPKAAPNTHANHLWNVWVCSKVWGWDSQDTLLISLRLSHVYGLAMVLPGVIYHANTAYLQEKFDPEETLKILATGKISLFNQVATAYAKLLDVKKNYDISKVRLCVSGGASLPPAVWNKFKEKYGLEILEVYGTTETGRIASNLLHERIPGSPGRPLPTVKLKISLENEVLVKSPGVFPGYYRNAEETKKSMTKDGWWRTGDIGVMENGRIVLKGRKQEKIIKYGYTISPRDIEWALYKMPQVNEVAVIGVQSPAASDDQIIYFLVSKASNAQIEKFYNANLPSVWRPDKIIKIDKIPRTRSGKVRIPALREMLK